MDPTPLDPARSAPGGTRRWALPWLVVVGWVVIVVAALPFASQLGSVQRDDTVEYLPASADSTRAARIQQDLPGGDTTELVLVYHRSSGLISADKTTADRQTARIAKRYRLTAEPSPRPSKDGTTLMVPISLGDLSDDARVEAVAEVRDSLTGLPQGLSVQVAGPGALNADAMEVFESIDGALMIATVVVVAVLLIITYRSPLLWLVPLLVVGVAAVLSRATVYGLVQGFDLTVTSMSASIMTVLVFGAGTDYALLIVARYREELRRHPLPYDAMRAALRACGPAVLASCATVATGLLCLLAADLNNSRGLGPVGAVGVVCALAAMVTLLPAVLVLLGRGMFWPLIPVHGSAPPARRGIFAAMGGSAGRRPGIVLAAGGVLLGALALGLLALPGNLKQEDSFTTAPDSVAALKILSAAYPDRSSQPVTVLARSARADEVISVSRAVDGVARVERQRSGRGWTEFAVFTENGPQSAGEQRTIERLRGDLDDVPGAQALVGGLSAQQLDLAATNSRDRLLVVPLVLVAVLVILAGLLRSITAPLLLVVAVVAVWGAALGLGGLVFEPLLGFPGKDSALPLLSFVFLVALGVDYGIFLMHRMREEALGGALTGQAAVTALRATGGVITSAGVVLAATFSVLMSLPLVAMVEMGFVIAAGVLLDTFLVRIYLVTSASLLLGERVWWPGRLSRRVTEEPVDGQEEPVDGRAAALAAGR